MCIEVTRTLKAAAKQLKEQYVWLLCYGVWTVGASVWIVLGAVDIWQFYGFEGSVADVLFYVQNPFDFGLLIMFSAMLMMQKMIQGRFTSQGVIRYATRKGIWTEQWRYSLLLAMGFSMFIFIVQIVTGRIFFAQWVNWNQEGSVYYANTGNLTNATFMYVGLANYAMYFLKIALNTILLVYADWTKKGKLIFWVFLAVQVGVELRSEGLPVFYQLFVVPYEEWTRGGVTGIKILIGVFVLAGMWRLGSRITEKKDFYL